MDSYLLPSCPESRVWRSTTQPGSITTKLFDYTRISMDSPENTAPVSVDIYAVLSILLVAIMWGATNPFIKRGSIGYNELKADSKLGQLWLEVRFLITRWQVSRIIDSFHFLNWISYFKMHFTVPASIGDQSVGEYRVRINPATDGTVANRSNGELVNVRFHCHHRSTAGRTTIGLE